jgi:hypothetical protein
MTNPKNQEKPTMLPNPMPAYSAGKAWHYHDKTGTLYQLIVGRMGTGQQWGLHLWRTAPNQKPELMYLIPDANGSLIIVDKELRRQGYLPVPGFIHWSDTPSSQVVNVDEAQVKVIKSEIATTQNIATQARVTANTAKNTADTTMARLVALEAKVASMEKQMLSRSQIEDIVWSKIWDVNYMIRMGFIQSTSAIREVQDYLNDLAVYIKRIVK